MNWAYTGADVGLQGVIVPPFINPANERLRCYFAALVALVLIYLLYQRFVFPQPHACALPFVKMKDVRKCNVLLFRWPRKAGENELYSLPRQWRHVYEY